MSKTLALALILVFLTASSTILAIPVSGTATAENTWVSKAPMSQARAGLGVVEVNGKIYAIGGTTASGSSPPDIFTGGFVGTNEEYNLATNLWTTKVSMPTPRDYFAIAAYQSKIYCIGGVVGFSFDEEGRHSYITTGVNEVYDPVTDTWETKKAIPFHASKMLANVVNDKIYVMQEFFMYAYDPISDSWTEKTKIPASPRTWSGAPPASFVVDDKIFVTGEFQTNDHLRLEQRVLIYDTVTDSWSEGKTGPTIVIGGGAGATTGVNSLQRGYVLGLVSGKFPPVLTNQVYDPKTNSWMTAKAMPTLRTDFGVAVVDDVLYAVGGYSYTSYNYGMVTPDVANEQYIPMGYGIPPEIKILSPLNQLYNESRVSLIFGVKKPVNWMGYSLDGQDNVTISGNGTVTDLPNGLHNVTIYANDTYGNIGKSETVSFTVVVPEPFSVVPVIAVSAVAVLVVVAVLLVYHKKHKHNLVRKV